jgi:carbon storage regulator
MLVIRRRPGEVLVIGEEIEIEILDSTPSQVKLGIRAPRSISVLRKEVQLTSQQNLAAVQEGEAVMETLRELKSARRSPIRFT